MSPIVVDGVLYGMTAAVQAFALDAATGRERWRFGDPLKACFTLQTRRLP